jgi:triacylglycerol lipase
MSHPPLVLIHGLWDTPQLFNRLVDRLQGRRDPLVIPYLNHGLGQVALDELTARLNTGIIEALGSDQPLDLLGFSMGGLLARAWIQEHGGHRRTRRFVCVGSPQRGTLVAQWMPRALLPSIADMKIGSAFLRRLAAEHRRQPQRLQSIDCRSFYCPFDLMVVPSWLGVLPVGSVQALPVHSHEALIKDPNAVAILADTLLAGSGS